MNKIVMIIFLLINITCQVRSIENPEGSISEKLKEKVLDIVSKGTEQIYKNNEELHKKCESSVLLSSNISLDNELRIYLNNHGIKVFPLESMQRLKKAFAKCACDNPKASAATLSSFNMAPLILACSRQLGSALLTEISLWGTWLWYYTKFVSYKTVGTGKPIYNNN